MTDFIQKIDHSWTLFLDRDGVINRRIYGGYVTDPEGFEFLPGVLASLKVFAKKFGRIIVVTNQQGIGKGLMTETQLHTLHHHMIQKVEQAGGRIDHVYYCGDLASLPNNGRKPSIHMANLAKADFPEIDFAKSVMVGDSLSDMEFGKNAGMFTLFVVYKHLPAKQSFDGVISGLEELATWIK